MIGMNQIKTIVVDLDRTLLHTDKSISPYTAAVLEECRRRSIHVMVATARPLRAVMDFCKTISFDAMVLSNGARIICGNQRTEYGICQDSARQILTVLLSDPALRITLETGDRAYSNLPIEDYETILTDDLPGIAAAEGALKILVSLDREDTLAFVKQAMTEDVYCTITNGHLVQIMSTAATKWNGIQSMLALCGCLAEETAYFGDDHDDLEPIKQCGLGVAVSNGIEEVKAAADEIAESNDADGVAKFIEQKILK